MKKILFIIMCLFIKDAYSTERLVLGAMPSHFITDGREEWLKGGAFFLDAMPMTDTDIARAMSVEGMEVEQIQRQSILLDFKSPLFEGFSIINQDKFRIIMFDWCVFNSATEYNGPKLQMIPAILENIKRLLPKEGMLYFSDVYNDDIKFLSTQLEGTGFNVEIKEDKDLPGELANAKFKAKGIKSLNIIATKQRDNELKELSDYVPWCKAHIASYRSGSITIDLEANILAMEKTINEKEARLADLNWLRLDIINHYEIRLKQIVTALEEPDSIKDDLEKEKKTLEDILKIGKSQSTV